MLNKIKRRFLNPETGRGLYKLPMSLLGIYITIFHLQYAIQALCLYFFFKHTYEAVYDLYRDPVISEAKRRASVEEALSEKKVEQDVTGVAI